MESQEAVSQEVSQEVIKRFELKTEAKAIKAVAAIFEIKNEISEETAIKTEKPYIIDAANVCMIAAKTEQARRVLSRFLPADNEGQKWPDCLKFEGQPGQVIKSLYSIEYLKKIFKILAASDSDLAASIQTNTDYPGIFETEHFKIVLAPRVENY